MAPSPAKMYAELLRNDLCAFIHRAFIQLNAATPFLPNWHIELLASKLEEVRRGTCKRLIINVPPRHIKSHATSIAFPAWILGHEPSKKILVVTYAQDFSDKLARDSRELMRSPFYQALFDARPSSEAISEYETTAGGYRLSTSIAGGLTGRGADIIIIDDPLKADDAQSDKRRGSVNDWYDNTLRSRLNSQEDGAIIIVMQRLHVDDLIGHVTAHETWDVVAIPAIAERDEIFEFSTPYGRRRIVRNDGDTLQPALLSRDKLELLRRGMTEYNFTAQYQQNPQPPGGYIVKREWLKFYAPDEKPADFGTIIQSWDTAVKDTELASFSVCTTWGVKDNKAYLLDVFRKRLLFPDLKRTVQSLAEQHNATVVLIEDRSSGSSLIQQLRTEGFSKVQAAPTLDGDKVMRLRGQTPMIESGQVLFPKSADWLDTYLTELLSFPSSNYDDQVDSTVYALAWIAQNPRWRGNLIKPDWIRYYTDLPEDQRYKRVFLSWDTAVTDGGQTDWTVCTAWMRLSGVYYLLDVERGIYEYPELRKVFVDLVQRHKPEQIQIEETSIGIALKNDRSLPQRSSIKLQPIEHDRKGRLYTQQIMFKEGTVQFPKHASFISQVEKELLNYPHGETDDIVDSISLALRYGARGYDTTLSWVG